jgi:hypothetical protein
MLSELLLCATTSNRDCRDAREHGDEQRTESNCFS